MAMTETAELEAAMAQRNRAVIERDVPYFQSILEPGYRHVHTTGKVDDRDSYVASVAKGDRVFPTVETTNYAIQIFETAATVFGDIFMLREGAPEGKKSRFVSVWHRRGERWMLAHWQVTAQQDGI